ncbi:MAG: thiolase [Alphaproteobacteria bacterium]
MTNPQRGSTAIVGVATAGFKGVPGRTSVDLAGECAVKALAEAGLTIQDVDGLFVCLPDDTLSGLTMSEYFGIQPKFTDNNRTGGSAFLTHTEIAAMALNAGLIDVALICYGSNQRSSTGKLFSSARPFEYESVYNPMFPATSYALSAARYMHEYGVSEEQLAEVAVSARKWANLNPEAAMQGPLTVEDCMASRMVTSPLKVRDCCLVTDGGAAAVMVRADRARDMPKKPAYLLGSAAATKHRNISTMDDFTVTAAVESGKRAHANAGTKPADIDVVEIYDAFTINTILYLEDLGFVKKGEAPAFIADGNIDPGGSLPVNTNGGGLSCNHPGMYGMFTIVEAVRQLRGEGDERQVKGVDLALAHGSGGVLSSPVTNIFGTEATL